MKHGAPDWTTLAESGVSHYEDKKVDYTFKVVGTFPNPTVVVDVDIIGSFGYIWLYGDGEHVRLRVKIDDSYVFYMSAYEMKNTGMEGLSMDWGKFGVTIYDAVNDIYGFFYDERWGLAIHSNLKIELGYTGGFAGKAACGIMYKELK